MCHHFEPKPNHFARKNLFFPREGLAACAGAGEEACAGSDLSLAAARKWRQTH